MQKHHSAWAARLLLLLTLALVAAACGGSDGADTEDSADAVDVENTDDGADDGADEGDDDGGVSSDESAAASEPAPAAVTIAAGEERDCAHSTAADGEDAAPVALPPAEKPEVDQALFGEYDELIVTDLIEGTGGEAVPGATISMQYVGVLASDGTEFDSSWSRGAQPFEFELGAGRVIAGWDQGIEGMKVGGRRVLQIPSPQAYGEGGSGAVIGPNADLIFIVDMVDVSAGAEPAPPVPEDSLGAFDALGMIDLVEGDGCEALPGDIISVHYVGVNAETGEEFDSSWGRGEPFQVVAGKGQVIDGWNEGIVGMKVGGERILQIPAALAYGDAGAGGAIGPNTDLVFRVHLEELIEAPYAHTVTFEGAAPSEVVVETITEGTGIEAAAGATLDTNIAVLFYKSGELLQSTWGQQTTMLQLVDGALLPGLSGGATGIKVGELRQIVIPPSVAYPEGVPPEAGLDDDDALVFILEPVRIIPG